MKRSRKWPVLALSLVMALTLCACGEKSRPVEEVYGLDLSSTEEQPMSPERVERSVLYTAVKGRFGNMTIFLGSSFAKTTYDDLKELLGVDASYYFYDEETVAKTFVWKASDEPTAKLAFWFRDDELYALGSTNLS